MTSTRVRTGMIGVRCVARGYIYSGTLTIQKSGYQSSRIQVGDVSSLVYSGIHTREIIQIVKMHQNKILGLNRKFTRSSVHPILPSET